jgi:hypothetical protein
VAGPVIEEKILDGALRQEWIHETALTIEEIEGWLKKGPHSSWPKNDDACGAFGAPCPYIAECKNGFQAKEQG